jgi:hypothetical protein
MFERAVLSGGYPTKLRGSEPKSMYGHGESQKNTPGSLKYATYVIYEIKKELIYLGDLEMKLRVGRCIYDDLYTPTTGALRWLYYKSPPSSSGKI